MDQHELRKLEERCIQEYAPECTAACPLHVDARAFVGCIARGDWIEALKLLNKPMPFPGILGRICDAPCEKKCLRGKVGDPIRIGALERACVTSTNQEQRVQSLPRRDKKVAVLGSGLSSLTAAHDLTRKGYPVTLFEPTDQIGGRLLEIDEARLPRQVLEDEVTRLSKLGVVFRMKTDLSRLEDLEELFQHYNAVYMGLDGRLASDWLAANQKGDGLGIQPLTQTTDREGFFAGGAPRPGGTISSVWEAAEGRWAATSMDRFLQKVSLSAGREKEGPYETRLFTSLEGVSFLPAVPTEGLQYSRQEAEQEAKRCLQCQCLECVKVCTYLERFGAYPKRYARDIYNNESIVMGTRHATN